MALPRTTATGRTGTALSYLRASRRCPGRGGTAPGDRGVRDRSTSPKGHQPGPHGPVTPAPWRAHVPWRAPAPWRAHARPALRGAVPSFAFQARAFLAFQARTSLAFHARAFLAFQARASGPVHIDGLAARLHGRPVRDPESGEPDSGAIGDLRRREESGPHGADRLASEAHPGGPPGGRGTVGREGYPDGHTYPYGHTSLGAHPVPVAEPAPAGGDGSGAARPRA